MITVSLNIDIHDEADPKYIESLSRRLLGFGRNLEATDLPCGVFRTEVKARSTKEIIERRGYERTCRTV